MDKIKDGNWNDENERRMGHGIRYIDYVQFGSRKEIEIGHSKTRIKTSYSHSYKVTVAKMIII